MRKTKAIVALHLAVMLMALPASPALAAAFPLAPETTAVGANGSYVTHKEDTLLDLARRYDLGYTQLVAANPGVDPWLPGVGRVLLPSFYLLPDARHRGIVINLGEERLFYYPPDGRAVITFPIGIGVAGRTTPLGVTRVIAKQKQPTWYPPASIRAREPGLPRAIPPGPDNPLGAFALFLGWPGYLIHGTNKPDGVGRMVSHGCIHLYPEDMAQLYQAIRVGTPVEVVDQPVEVRWVGDALFAEVHPTSDQAEALERSDPRSVEMPADLPARVVGAIGNQRADIDWSAVKRAGSERSGVPVKVAVRRTAALTVQQPADIRAEAKR